MAENQKAAAMVRTRKVTTQASRLYSYAQKSVGELIQKLLTLAEGSKGGKLSNELKDVVYVLKAHKLRSSSHAHVFRTHGGLHALLKFISRCKECEGRDLVLLLGTLGNLCALEPDTRCTVMTDALSDIVYVLKNSVRSDTLNTSSRVLANLALDESSIDVLLGEGVLAELSRTLVGDCVDEGCKQSVLRAIRLFSSNSDCRDELKNNDGIVPIIDCLKSDAEEVALAALHVVEVLTLDGDTDFIQALCNNGAIPYIVKQCACLKPSVTGKAVTVLLNCAKNSDGRVALSSAGGIEALVGHLTSCDLPLAVFQKVIRMLCACCRDVLSRQRLRDCGGLGKLIEMLSKAETISLHGDILSALICYYFDENTLKFMVKRLGLLKVLTHHLQEMTGRLLNAAGKDDCSLNQEEVGIEGEGEEERNVEAAAIKKTSDVTNEASQKNSENAEGCDSPCCSECTSESSCESDHNMSSSDCSSLDSSPSIDASSVRDGQASGDMAGAEAAILLSATVLAEAANDDQTRASDFYATPPALKRPCLQLDIEASTPMPANFIDSLLSSPSPYQRQHKLESPLTADFGAPIESQVILLLSRVSHLRDCLTSLAVPDVLLTILKYFASSEPPNIHVFKVLMRIFTNPHCFQDLIISLVPSQIYEQLSLPADMPSVSGILDEQYLGGSVSPLNIASHLPSPSEVALQSQHSQTYPVFSPLCYSMDSPVLFPNSSQVFHGMCYELLERLSKVAESPYGQGVLAHLLLRGETSEKHASCLALPLLCRSPRIYQRMMLGYKGLQILGDLAVKGEFEIQTKALNSLLALVKNVQKLSCKRRSSIPEEDSMPTCKRPRLDCSPSSSTEGEISPHDMYLVEVPNKVFCCYHDSDHCPFDLTVVVSDKHTTLQMPVHRSILSESSDVFSVMLSGHYKEALCNEVCIREVPPLAFMSLLHHIYGCGWLCPVVMEEVLKRENMNNSSDCELMTTTHISNCRSTDDANSSIDVNTQVSEKPFTASTVHAATEVMIKEVCHCTRDYRTAAHCLQVLTCAGQFLLPELMALCEHHFASSLLCPSNIVPVFHFARLHQCCCLAESCLHCVVAMPHSELRREIFGELVASSEGTSVLVMIDVFLSSVLL